VRPAKPSCHWCGPIAGWLPPSTTVRLVPPLKGPDIGETSSDSETGSAEAISMLPRARSVEGVAFEASSTHASRDGASTRATGFVPVDIEPQAEACLHHSFPAAGKHAQRPTERATSESKVGFLPSSTPLEPPVIGVAVAARGADAC